MTEQVIIRTPDNGHLDQMPPVGEHRPEWTDTECKWCGDGGCGPHPDVLICTDCGDDWPCYVVEAVSGELDRLGDGLCCGNVLSERAAQLRGQWSGGTTGDGA